MCLVPDHELLSMMEIGKLRIVDFSEQGLTPNGYDLRVAEVRLATTDVTQKEGTATIPPQSMFYISTIERVELPDDVAAQLWTRTSWIRKGLLVGLGKVDAGFHGTLTFMGFNASSLPVEIPIGSRFVQIVFEYMHSPVDMTYEKRSGNYQGQKGITLCPGNKP
ncbi:MAG: dCTP deaminase, dUMP-forming [Methanomassiliicoccales archaeon PtaU1.Bin124]|nr:MAG: dCTP deaminase, dUMP-forming [Methanomassiliicoccales archaeon PtaU1.Bin124]